MLTVLLIVILVSISVSALCSLMEAALFAVPLPHVKHLSDSNSKSGHILLDFKADMRQPISAILILNTISNTCGAAIAGALVARLYPDHADRAVVVFSVVFTLMILYLSEIVPKQIGGLYAKRTAEVVARPLLLMVKILRPLVKTTEGISTLISRRCEGQPSISEEEVLSMAAIGTEEGVLDHLEGSVIRNVVGLDRLQVKDILTPRVVVFRVREDSRLSEIREDILEWSHTRVPLFQEAEPDHIIRYVIQRDLFRELLKGETDLTLKELSRPLTTVSEFMRADQLLLQMFEKRESICSVVDEHGGFAGLVTLEDIIEEIVGREIVDEYDLVSDLRSYARIIYSKRKMAEKKGPGVQK